VSQGPGEGIDPAWLLLRAPADARARTTSTAPLTDALARHLRRGHHDGAAVRLLDVGAGAGAGASWLRARLPFDQRWRLVDHDPRILAAAAATVDGWGRTVLAGVAGLPAVLADEPADVVTCQALLDLLTPDEVDALLASAVACRAAVLLGLSVDGDVDLSPSHPDDRMVGEAFDAHQRRAGRLGPDAGAYAADALHGHGYAVTVAATPWHLGATEPALTRAWIRGRAEAATEQEPGQAERIAAWRRSREDALASGRLEALVGHTDVLGLPAPRGRAA
jgi:trans-aconitate methyltransferase